MGRKKKNTSEYASNKNRILTHDEILKLPKDEQIKYEIADELGIYEKVLEGGWKSLSASENGRIGGMVAKRKRDMENNKATKDQ